MSNDQIHKIFIGNLAPTVTEFLLVKVLRTCGKLKNLSFKWRGDGMGGRGRRGFGSGGYMFAEFFNRAAAKKAIHLLHNQRIHGRAISCTFAAAKVGLHGELAAVRTR